MAQNMKICFFYACRVRWLSRGSFLERFINLLPRIIEFLGTMGARHEQHQDPLWVKEIAIVRDFMGHYNSLNLQLQSAERVRNV